MSRLRSAQKAAIAISLTLPMVAAAKPAGRLHLAAASPPSRPTTLFQPPRPVNAPGKAAGPLSKSGWIDPRDAASIKAGTTPVVYASITADHEILAYATNTKPTVPPTPPAPVETITGLDEPAAIAVDQLRNLYVVELASNDIKVFKPGSLVPFETLLPGPGAANLLSVAVDGRGTVYAGTSNGSIEVYPKGATAPSKTLSDVAIQSANGIAVDGAGNIFLNYVGLLSSSTEGYAVGAIPVTTSIGVTFFHRLSIDIAPDSPQPLGLTLDKKGDLVIADTMGNVSLYRPATNTPAQSFQATGLIGNVFNINLALTGPSDQSLLVAPHDTSTIYSYAYPSGTLQPGIELPSPTVVEGLATSPPPSQGVW